MDRGDESSAYQQAIQRWPNLDWPESAYTDHRQGNSDRNPCDLYLAGAAGHRLAPAWAAIESQLAQPVQKILKRFPKADYHDLEELWSNVRDRLIRDDPRLPKDPKKNLPLPDLDDDGTRPAKIIRYRGQQPLINHMVLIGRNIARDRKRQLQRRGRAVSIDAGDPNDPDGKSRVWADKQATLPPAESAQGELIRRLKPLVVAAWDALSDEQKLLVRMVHQEEMQKKDAGALLGWSPFKTSRQLGAAMDIMREALDEITESVGDASPELIGAWQAAFAEVWGLKNNVESEQADDRPASETGRGGDRADSGPQGASNR